MFYKKFFFSEKFRVGLSLYVPFNAFFVKRTSKGYFLQASLFWQVSDISKVGCTQVAERLLKIESNELLLSSLPFRVCYCLDTASKFKLFLIKCVSQKRCATQGKLQRISVCYITPFPSGVIVPRFLINESSQFGTCVSIISDFSSKLRGAFGRVRYKMTSNVETSTYYAFLRWVSQIYNDRGFRIQ